MEFSFFLRGFVLGFSIAAPVGPIGILCIRNTLTRGLAIGFVSGLGAATADGFYGSVAGFGLSLITDFLVAHSIWLRLMGGAFLCYLGVTTFLAKSKLNNWSEVEGESHSVLRASLWSAYLSTLFLTITNPLTILAFATMFAGLGLVQTGGNTGNAIALVCGVFLGSATWWFILSYGVSLFRHKFNPHILRWVNRLAGIMIVAFGLVALLSVWR